MLCSSSIGLCLYMSGVIWEDFLLNLKCMRSTLGVYLLVELEFLDEVISIVYKRNQGVCECVPFQTRYFIEVNGVERQSLELVFVWVIYGINNNFLFKGWNAILYTILLYNICDEKLCATNNYFCHFNATKQKWRGHICMCVCVCENVHSSIIIHRLSVEFIKLYNKDTNQLNLIILQQVKCMLLHVGEARNWRGN